MTSRESPITCDERIPQALATLLRIAVAHHGGAGNEVDARLLARVVELVEQHELDRTAKTHTAGTHAGVAQLATEIYGLLARRPSGDDLATRFRSIVHGAGLTVPADAMARVLGDLEPPAVGSVGGPQEAAARAAVLICGDPSAAAITAARHALRSDGSPAPPLDEEPTLENVLRFVVALFRPVG